MRVLMLSKACIVGIYQKKLEAMAAQDPDLELRVLVPPSWRDERGETKLERVYTHGYELIETPIRFNGSYHLHYYPQFSDHLRQFQPHIVHVDEEPYNLSTWLAMRTAKRAKLKAIFFSWQNILRRYPPPFNAMERAVLQLADYAIAGTESAAQVWRQKGYTGAIAVIPQFGVDPDLFHPREFSKSNGIVQIGYAGRLWHGKGLDLLIEALAMIRDLEWVFHLVGSGPEKDKIYKLIHQKGLTERVQCQAWLPSTDMPDFMRQLDILVLPSRTLTSWKEQYGRVLIEAMSSQVAVVGSSSGAIPNVIEDSGLIFPEEDVITLAAHLRRLITEPTLRQKLGIQGRERVLKHFTQEQIATETVRVYHQLYQA
ncbi:MAG: glycosyl transferase family 1 [Phototrophicales bacterium]|nr:MAG: glycosyl transferase family 1 [Phototrophicales bacterium]